MRRVIIRITTRVMDARCSIATGRTIGLFLMIGFACNVPQTFAGVILSEDFSNDPVVNGRATVSGDGSRFSVAGGAMVAHYDTQLATTRMTWNLVPDLSLTLNDITDFQFSTRFKIASAGYFADPNQSAQIAFGLQNSGATGPDRAGGGTGLAKSYDIATVDYFPNVSPTFGGPSLMSTVVQTDPGNGSGYFSQFLFPKRAESKLSDAGESPLPLDTFLTSTLTYNAATRTMKITMLGPSGLLPINLVGGSSGLIGGPDGDVTTIQLSIPTAATFSVNQFAVMLWQDSFNTTASSVKANVTFDSFSVSNSLSTAVSAGSGTWANGSGDHKWTTNTGVGSNWNTAIPSSAGHVATFDNTGLSATTSAIDLNGDKTIGQLVLSTTSTGYTIGLSSTTSLLNFDNGTSNAAIMASGGAHVVNAKVVTSATSDLDITTQSGGSLSLAGGIENSINAKTLTLSQSGSGTLSVGKISNDGLLALVAGSSVTTGNIDGTPLSATTFNGTMTVGNNAVITANRIVQNSLAISGTAAQNTAKVTIASSTGSPNAIAGLDSQISKLASLSIDHNTSGTTTYPNLTSPTTYYGTLDLKNNDLFVTYGNDPGDGAATENELMDMVRSGANRTGGVSPWNGTGIISSTAALNGSLYTLAVFDNGALNLQHQGWGDGVTNVGTVASPFIAPLYHGPSGSVVVQPNTIIVKFTYAGDTNGDGIINLDDYQAVDTHLGQTNSAYRNGDTNFDGVVNLDDYQVIDVNINNPIANSGVNGGANAVPLPEPSSLLLGLLALVGLWKAGRHRKPRKVLC